VGAWLDERPVHDPIHVGEGVGNLRISLFEGEGDDDNHAIYDDNRDIQCYMSFQKDS
jgi:hypothetical protein